MEHSELSRYERMRRILDQAAVGANASYQGRGPFWQLPLSDLLSCELYGVRLIPPAAGSPERGAPPPTPTNTPSCCGRAVHEPRANPSAPADPSRGAGRGAASGLVRGLRGQAPFDGSQFPRLPWGGRPVAADDIAMIEGWIDDGCPAQEGGHGAASSVAVNPSARAHGLEAHPLATEPVNVLRGEHGGPRIRKNVDSLSASELERLRAALNEMHRYDAFSLDERGYTYWARIHGNNCQHGWEEFMPWHRLYLYFFELALQDIDASVTVPYWDWPAYYDQDRTATAPDSGVIPPAFRCYVNEAVLEALAPQIPASVQNQLRSTLGHDYNSGLRLLAAAGIEYGRDPAVDDAIFAALTRENPLFYRQRWPGGNNALLFEDYPAPGDVDNILSLASFFDFGSGPAGNHFYGAIENIHNLIHNFSGGINPRYDPRLPPQNRKEPQYGDMVAPGVTAFDPLFWAHHSNVDRLWAAWQDRHPSVGPDNPGAVLPPWPQTVGDTATIARFGYEYARAVQMFPAQPDMDLTRFRSARVSAHPHSPARRVEVRLHGVQHRLQGGSLRVFINASHVDEHTQTRNNPHYAGQFHLFAGPCIGGPAHCDVPAGRPVGDQRARHRKTPGHLRLDVTQLVQRLRSQGEQELDVQVLALDHAGKPAGDVLRLHSVALYSFD